VGLIDADPEDSEGRAAADVIVDKTLKAIFKVCLAGFDGFIFTGLASRQGVELVGGMKEDAGPNEAPEAIAEDEIADDEGDLVTELVMDVRKEAAGWAHCGVDSVIVVEQPAGEERLEGVGDYVPYQLDRGMPGHCDGCLIEENHSTRPAGIPL
jgi:hypothetical protein